MFKRIIICIFLIHIFSTKQGDCIFKMTKVTCKSEDSNFSRIQTCRLKPLRRHETALNIHVVLLQLPITNAFIHVELYRRSNGYKPFLVNNTWDMCAFLVKRNKMTYLKIIYDLFKNVSNMNHSCPYNHDIIVDNFVPFHKDMPLPWPTGEYLLTLAWIVDDISRVVVDVGFEFMEENIFARKPSKLQTN